MFSILCTHNMQKIYPKISFTCKINENYSWKFALPIQQPTLQQRPHVCFFPFSSVMSSCRYLQCCQMQNWQTRTCQKCSPVIYVNTNWYLWVKPTSHTAWCEATATQGCLTCRKIFKSNHCVKKFWSRETSSDNLGHIVVAVHFSQFILKNSAPLIFLINRQRKLLQIHHIVAFMAAPKLQQSR